MILKRIHQQYRIVILDVEKKLSDVRASSLRPDILLAHLAVHFIWDKRAKLAEMTCCFLLQDTIRQR